MLEDEILDLYENLISAISDVDSSMRVSSSMTEEDTDYTDILSADIRHSHTCIEQAGDTMVGVYNGLANIQKSMIDIIESIDDTLVSVSSSSINMNVYNSTILNDIDANMNKLIR